MRHALAVAIAASALLSLSQIASAQTFGAYPNDVTPVNARPRAPLMDDGRIAFTSARDGDYEIFVVNPDGSGETRLTNNATDDKYPAWSPDGKHIAFSTNRDGNFEIYVMDSDGMRPIRLTAAARYDGDPAWSPDGTRIAFTSDRDGYDAIYVMRTDGSDQLKLSNAGIDYKPAWSPDGTHIAFETYRQDAIDVYTMRSDGSRLTNLTPGPGTSADPAWSPDGNWIAFRDCSGAARSGLGSDCEIVLIKPDGSAWTQITNNLLADVYPTWSPSGTRIAIGQGEEGFAGCIPGADARCSSDIEIINADGTGETRAAQNGENPDWGPSLSAKPTPAHGHMLLLFALPTHGEQRITVSHSQLGI